MNRRPLTLLIAALGLLAAAGPGRAASVDLELILAVDASSSINYSEFALQMNGLAAAFRDENVIAAIEAGKQGAIAVSVLQWSSPGAHRIAPGWTLIRDAASARAFADTLDNTPRFIKSGGTGISAMLAFAAPQFRDNGFEGTRRVIDISGDGRDTHGPHLNLSRDPAIAAGITINGLPILTDEPDLDRYFSAEIIGGPGAFTVPAATYGDFASAVLAKLIQEIRGRPLVSGRDPTGLAPG